MLLNLSVGCWTYDRTRPLVDGRVEPRGIRLRFHHAPPHELFRRQLADAEFDISEFSLARWLMLVDRGDDRFVGLPVFTSKMFRHSAIYTSDMTGISSPARLRGGRVGLTHYTVTAGVWVRGLLEQEYDVPLSSISWYWGGLSEPEDDKRLDFRKPQWLRISQIPQGNTLEGMLLNGALDALISPAVPKQFGPGSPIVRVLPDYRQHEVTYYRRTRILPIMHCVVLKRQLYEENPWIARELYRAFDAAKSVCLTELESTSATLASVVWLHSELELQRAIFEGDPWAYGISANRRALAAFSDLARNQGLTERLVQLEEMFVPELWDS